MSEDKNPKPNGLGGDPMQRLASLKAPRDLKLGASKPNKKIFTPNLNVARNRNKGPAADVKQNAKEQKNDKGRRDRREDRNKNFRNGPNIIKSSGVFSEGIGGTTRRQSERASYSRDSDPQPVLQRPTIRVKDVVKIDKELEEQKIRAVMGESSNGTDDDSIDFKEVVDKDAPIKLPMDNGSWNKTPGKPTVKVKQELVVKTELEDGAEPVPQVEEKLDVKDVFENTDVVNLLRNHDKSTLILLQLPDTLPGRGGRVDDDGPRRRATNNTDQPSTSEPKEEENPKDNRCRLADLEEGRIGKLLVRRSGKVTLALGDTIFEVSMGTKAAFHQEAVSVAVNEESRSANMVSLGPLHHKLNITPDWETMFRDMPI